MGAVPYIANEADFDQRTGGEVPVLVDFTATWCGPCKALAPILDELTEEFTDDALQIVKVDADDYPQISERFNVSGLPTLILFQEGEELMRLGGSSKADLKAKIEQFV